MNIKIGDAVQLNAIVDDVIAYAEGTPLYRLKIISGTEYEYLYEYLTVAAPFLENQKIQKITREPEVEFILVGGSMRDIQQFNIEINDNLKKGFKLRGRIFSLYATLGPYDIFQSMIRTKNEE